MSEDNEDGFGFGDPCPNCGGMTLWRGNFVRRSEKGFIEFGRFQCTNCGAISGFHELEIMDNE